MIDDPSEGVETEGLPSAGPIKTEFDYWRLADTLIPLATPITVAIIALLFNMSERDRDQRNKMEQERIARYALIPSFMDALTGDDLAKKDLAVRSVTAILGADGETLLAGLQPATVSALPQEALQIINDATNSRTSGLVDGLFSGEHPTQINSYRDLLLSGPRSETVIPFVLDAGNTEINNIDGVKYSLEYLANADSDGLIKWSREISQFLDEAEKNGPETSLLADKVRLKLRQLDSVE